MVYRSRFSQTPKADDVNLPATTERRAQLVRTRRTRGRPLKWRPTPLSASDRTKASEYIKRYGSDTKTKRRVLRQFEDFILMNHLSREEALPLVLGQMINQGLGRGAAKNYLLWMAKTAKRNSDTWEAVSAATRGYADVRLRQARSMDLSLLNRLLDSLPERHKLIGEFMAITGLRHKDATRLRRHQVSSICTNKGAQALRLFVTCAKNIVERDQARCITIPCWFRTPSEDLISHLSTGDSEELLFEDAYASFQGWLRENFDASTYSLRRHFMNVVFDVTKGDLEIAARKYTMHRNPNMLAAFYLDWRRTRDFEVEELNNWINGT